MGYTKLDVEDVLSKLTRPEKISLLAGSDMWHTAAVEHLNIPRVRMSDGPNGIRGIRFFGGTPANCFPAATGLAASFDRDLLYRIGVQVGKECKSKGAHIWLGPTLNIQRSPLGGRGFESYSEDPFLSGWMSASSIKGAQSQGVAATPKHYVTNDQELERNSSSSDLSMRALREIYLKAFQIAFREGKPWACMTAYNKMNGTHASHSKLLLDEILHKEWAFDGMTMSDWYGTYTTVEAVKAGLDLEMPGPPGVRGDALARAMNGGLVTDEDLNILARRVLNMVNRAIDSNIPFEKEEELDVNDEVRALLKEAAIAATVLIKNEKNTLPLDTKKIKKLAVIGGNARDAYASGGGSASMRTAYAVDPLSAIIEQANEANVEVNYAMGVFSARYTPLLDRYVKNANGQAGHYDFAFYAEDPTKSSTKPIHTMDLESANNFMVDNIPFDIVPRHCYARMTCSFTPDASGLWEFGVAVNGQANLYINDRLVVSNAENQVLGDIWFGTGTIEEKGEIELTAGKTYNMRLEWSNFKPVNPNAAFEIFGGWRVGGLPRLDASKGIEEAVALAKESDAVVLVTGLNADYESEGFDRPDMKLPPRVDEMISKVLDANSNAIVVIQSGTQCEMPWIAKAPALVQAFYGGNETGTGIASLLFGKHCPSSKLSLTFPERLEDVPSHPFFPGRDGHAFYNEEVFVGYRGMMSKPLIGCFGHGLSYTTFSLDKPKVGKVNVDVSKKTISLKVDDDVKNTGDKFTGAEIVQCYISPPKDTPLPRPERELAGFARIELKPGESGTASMELERGAFSYFHPLKRLDESAEDGCWVVQPGKYTIHIGTSLMDIKYSEEVNIEKGFHWMGL